MSRIAALSLSSATTQIDAGLNFLTSSYVDRSRGDSVEPCTTTAYPCRAISSAMPLPIPRLEPVTRTTFCFSFIFWTPERQRTRRPASPDEANHACGPAG